MDILKLVGRNVREIRKQNGLTLKDLAEMIGKKPQHLSRWELGQHDPGLRNLAQLADALGVAVGVFFQKEAPEADAFQGAASGTNPTEPDVGRPSR